MNGEFLKAAQPTEPFVKSPIVIESLDDPRVEVYRNLKMRNLQRDGNYFIAEGKKVVERLLVSDFETASVFICQKHLDEWLPRVPLHVPLYTASQSVMNDLVGFDFHVGVLGCGVRRAPRPLEELLAHSSPRLTVVACPSCDNPENMGAIVRIGAAFGIDALLLGKGCCDAFSRRVIRVSMGTTFTLPIVESKDLFQDLVRLREEWNFELAATVLDPESEELDQATRGPRFGILMGNEDMGLDRSWVSLCNRKLSIPMCRGTDSLNVAVASGIMLHHLTREKTFRDSAMRGN